MSLTPSGVHFLYRLPQGVSIRPGVKKRIKGVLVDIRADDSYVVAPPSRHPSGSLYEMLGTWRSAPVFDPAWIDERQFFPARKPIQNISTYLKKVFSIEGQHVSAGLVRAAAVCRDARLSESQATIEHLEWNREPVVSPPWSAQELTRAITRVYEGAVR